MPIEIVEKKVNNVGFTSLHFLFPIVENEWNLGVIDALVQNQQWNFSNSDVDPPCLLM